MHQIPSSGFDTECTFSLLIICTTYIDMIIPQISVVIPVYNQERYLDQCLRSVLQQDFKDIEVIVVNDGSTDKSLEVCQKYAAADSRIAIIDKRNEGQAYARRDGILKAKGEYVMFVDSDDHLPDGAFKNLLESSENRQVDLVVGNYERVYDCWGFVKQQHPINYPCGRRIERDEYRMMILGFEGLHQHPVAVYLWGRLYRRSCVVAALQENGALLFPEETNYGEDLFFNLAVMPYINNCMLTDKVVYHYRYGGVTSRHMPIIQRGCRYFDTRYEFCYTFGCQQCLPSFFFHYLSLFYQEIRMQLHFHVDSEDGIRQFISKELSERKIVRWATEKLALEDESDDKIRAVSDKDVDCIMELAFRDEKRMWRHYLMKDIVLFCQKLFG